MTLEQKGIEKGAYISALIYAVRIGGVTTYVCTNSPLLGTIAYYLIFRDLALFKK